MKKSFFVIALVIWTIACASNRGRGVEVAGRVVDNSGTPVPGVTVSTGGAAPVTTNAAGEFRLTRLSSTPRRVVNFRNAGYVESTQILRGNINIIVIWPRAAAVTIDAGSGGSVPLGNGGSLVLPPNGLVNAAGQPVSGPVSVSATYFDVSDEAQLRAVPGDFTARMRDGSERVLQSYGVFDVAITDAQSQPVNLAPGTSATVAVPIASRFGDRAPARSGRFSFDRGRGQWVEEGAFERQGGLFVGPVTQVNTAWNVDDVVNTTCITVRVLNPFQNNMPEANCRVEASGVGYASTTTGYTNAAGEVCLLVKRNDAVQLRAFSSQQASWQSVPITITTPNVSAGQTECGTPGLCPVTTIELDILLGGGRNQTP